jgi:protocatechuate 3,4-dioxygenase beta subunit
VFTICLTVVLIGALLQIPSGRFTRRAWSPGDAWAPSILTAFDQYLPQTFGQRDLGAMGPMGKLISVRSSYTVYGIESPAKMGAIGGTVVDAQGAPLSKVRVRAYLGRANELDAFDWTLSEAGIAATTDDSGRYRLAGLRPGAYVVEASIADSPAETGMGPAFFPDTTNPVSAAVVRVSPGVESQGVNLTLRQAQALPVSGTVFYPTQDGNNAGQSSATGALRVRIALYRRGPARRIRGRGYPLTGFSDANGRFEFSGVTPGPYRMVAVDQVENRVITAIRDIEVQAGMQPITLELQHGVDVPGELRSSDPIPAGFALQNMKMALVLAEPLNSLHTDIVHTIWAGVSSDGSFVFRDVIPDARYRVMFNGIDQRNIVGYFEGGRYGSINPLAVPVTVRQDQAKLQLQMSFSLGRVEVMVMDRQKPGAGVLTVLAPAIRSSLALYHAALSDANGRVAFSNVKPGDYKVFAWEDVRPGNGYSPGLMAQFEDQGRPVHVERSGRVTETVEVMRVDRMASN